MSCEMRGSGKSVREKSDTPLLGAVAFPPRPCPALPVSGGLRHGAGWWGELVQLWAACSLPWSVSAFLLLTSAFSYLLSCCPAVLPSWYSDGHW